MKSSMKKIFNALQNYLLFILIIATFGVAVTLEYGLSFEKADLLREQKEILHKLLQLPQDDIEFSLLECNSKSATLLQKSQELQSLYRYNFLEKYLLGNEKEYFSDIQKLKSLIKKFNEAAQKYYQKELKTKKENKKQLQKAFIELNSQIDRLIIQNSFYNEKKFAVIKYAVIALFILVLLATLYYRKKLTAIYEDIAYLLQIDKSPHAYTLYTQEADALSLRMKRKHIEPQHPEHIDKTTGLKNYKGLLSSYARKKNIKESKYTSVTLIEINTLSQKNAIYPEDVTDKILKKIAYTISLHALPVDIIARTEYNQFVLVFWRATKEQAFKDAQTVMQSLSELRFKLPGAGEHTLNASGGFVIKPTNTSLEEALKKAKEIAAYARETTTNKVLQTRDLAQREF